MTMCPICGESTGGLAKHIEIDHDPEDLGLSPMGDKKRQA